MINNKLFENIKKINLIEKFSLDSKKIALIFIISSLFLYLDFSYLLKAQMGWIKKSSEGIVKLNNDIQATEIGLNNMRTIKAQQKNLPVKKIKKVISDSQLPSLLQEISKLGNANNIRILQIKPLREPQKAAPGSVFIPVLIGLDLDSGYHSLGKFINDLENNDTFIAVDSFKIEAQPKEVLKHKVSLILKTYVRK